MDGNVLNVKFVPCEQNIETAPLYQYDYGQRITFNGVNLPDLYEVHFSNTKSGDSVTVIGDSTGVDIPDALLQTGAKIYGWIYLHAGEDDGETEYRFIIPVIGRAKPTHEEPTPVQQTEIERLIALAEEIIEHGGGGSGEDGFSPIVTVTEITGGHRISITDKTHTVTFDVMDGTDGTNGTNGTDGTDGVSPTIQITQIAGGHRVTITDKRNPSGVSFNVMDGADGETPEISVDDDAGKHTILVNDEPLTTIFDGSNGVSPAVSISAITGGHAITITDALHPNGQTFNVMDGIDGQDGADGQDGSDGQDGADGSDYVLTAQDKSDIAALVNVSTPRIVKTSSDTTAELEPNKFYVFPEMSALTITLATPTNANIVNEYHFIFTSGATATTLTIPQTVNEPSGFSVEANMVYEVSIMENCMLVNSWAVSS